MPWLFHLTQTSSILSMVLQMTDFTPSTANIPLWYVHCFYQVTSPPLDCNAAMNRQQMSLQSLTVSIWIHLEEGHTRVHTSDFIVQNLTTALCAGCQALTKQHTLQPRRGLCVQLPCSTALPYLDGPSAGRYEGFDCGRIVSSCKLLLFSLSSSHNGDCQELFIHSSI